MAPAAQEMPERTERAEAQGHERREDRDPPAERRLHGSEHAEEGNITTTEPPARQPAYEHPRAHHGERTADRCSHSAQRVWTESEDHDLRDQRTIDERARNASGLPVHGRTDHRDAPGKRLGDERGARHARPAEPPHTKTRRHASATMQERRPSALHRAPPTGERSHGTGDQSGGNHSGCRPDNSDGHVRSVDRVPPKVYRSARSDHYGRAMAPMSQSADDQDWRAFDGLWNFRPVEAILANGHRLRPGRLLRSDQPYRLDATQRRQLLERYAIGKILDLRTAEECAPTESIDAPRTHLPLPDVSRDPRIADGSRNLAGAYRAMLDDHAPTLVRAIDAIGVSTPVLVHCTAGKDRTGIVVALTLELVGARRDDIVRDYVESGRRLAALTERALARGYEPTWRDLAPEVLGAPPAAIITVLETVEERWGSVDRFLMTFGMTPARIEAIRSSLIT